jgi:hypothetical protein
MSSPSDTMVGSALDLEGNASNSEVVSHLKLVHNTSISEKLTVGH